MFRRKAAASPPSPTESEPPSPPPPSEVSSPPETPSPPPPEVPSPPEVAAPTAPVTKKTVMKKPKKKQAGEARERAAAREALLSMDVGTPKPATVNEKTDEPTRKDDPEPPIEETESPSMEVDPPAPPANHSPASPQSPSFSSSAIQTIFAPFQIITRIAEKAVDVAVGNTKEDILKRKVQMSLEHVANNPILDGVIGNLMRLLKVGVDLMDQFECNYFAAKVFKQRLSKAIVCLAYPRRSIFAQKMDYDSARLESQEDYKKIIADLEITLSSSLRFFSRFTQPDHVLHSLVGKECKDQFSHLNEKLESSLKDLHQTLGCSHSSILLPAIDHYTVVCDLKVMVDEDARNRDAFITRIKEERKYNDDDITEFIEELEEVKKWVKETSSIAKALVGPWPGSHSCYGIRQRNLQRFWIESLGMHCISVTPTEFIDAARTYFEALYYNDDLNEGDDVIVASLLDEVLPKMLDMIPKDPAYPECMDFFSLAKHVRSLPLQGSAVSIFQKLAASIAEGGTCILPPPPASPLPSSQFVASSTPQTFWESDDEMLVFNELISSMTPAWAVISGPKYSGKTHRLLTACHLTRSSGEVVKDYVWIDLAGVSNDKEAISKIASQLCFRGICDMEQLSLCLFSYLKALRAGSVVVVDNVDTESPVLSPCLHSLLSTFHDASNATSTSSLRFILSCRVADSTLLEKITGPLNKNNVPLTQINVSPLSSAPAAHMASNLKAISFPLLPTDAQAIVTAGLSLPGLMSIIINQCTLSVIRKLANDISTAQTSSTPPPSVSSPDDEAIKSFYVEAAASVAKELGADERLCALCMSFLPRPSTPFSEPLAWALCRNAFNGDLIRWLVAFRGLVDCNWFVSTTDNHYIPSFLSSLCPPSALGLVDAKTMAEGGDGASSGNGDAAPEGELKPQADSSTSVASTPSSITEDGQRTLYLNYWVSFLISMSEMSVLSASALEQFNTHYMHISTVLGLFAEESSDPQTSKGVSSSDIAVRLAGFLSPILTQYYPQPVGLRIAVAVETALRDVGDASASLRAACDVGRQMRRGTPGKKAKAFHKEAIANLKGAINKHITAPDLDKARASTLLACLLYEFNSRSESSKVATMAYTLWENIPTTRKDVEGDLKDLKTFIPPPEPKKSPSDKAKGTASKWGKLNGVKKAFSIFRRKSKKDKETVREDAAATEGDSGDAAAGGGEQGNETGGGDSNTNLVMGLYGRFPLMAPAGEGTSESSSTEPPPTNPDPNPSTNTAADQNEGKPKEDGLLLLLQMMDSDALPPPTLPSPDEEEPAGETAPAPSTEQPAPAPAPPVPPASEPAPEPSPEPAAEPSQGPTTMQETSE